MRGHVARRESLMHLFINTDKSSTEPQHLDVNGIGQPTVHQHHGVDFSLQVDKEHLPEAIMLQTENQQSATDHCCDLLHVLYMIVHRCAYAFACVYKCVHLNACVYVCARMFLRMCVCVCVFV